MQVQVQCWCAKRVCPFNLRLATLLVSTRLPSGWPDGGCANALPCVARARQTDAGRLLATVIKGRAVLTEQSRAATALVALTATPSYLLRTDGTSAAMQWTPTKSRKTPGPGSCPADVINCWKVRQT